MANASFRKLFQNWDKQFDTEELDELRELIATSLRRQQKHLTSEHESYAEFDGEDAHDFQSYQYHLEDRWNFTREVQRLSDELAIVALFKQVELHTKRVAKKTLPLLDVAKIFKVDFLKKHLPFVAAIPEFSAFDELRLLNNSIKHEGKVSKQLASAFPIWKVGQELTGLGESYERLLPDIKSYVQAFVAACYSTSQGSKA